MNKLIFFILLLGIVLATCSPKSLNRNQDKRKTSASKESQITASKQWFEQQELWQNDSSENSYSLWLKPEGVFSFDPQKGFTGHAALLKINGKQRQVQQRQIRQKQLSLSHSAQKSKESSSQQAQIKTKTLLSPTNNLSLYVFVFLLFALGYYYYQRKR